MRELLRLVSFRYLRAHRVRTLLGFVSIALGVALYVSADVANRAIALSVEQTVRDLAGQAEWQVVNQSGGGVDAGQVAAIRAIPGAIAAPVVQTTATLVEPRDGSLIVLGVDFQSDAMLRLYRVKDAPDPLAILRMVLIPDSVVITRRFADRHGLAAGGSLKINTPGGIKKLAIGGVIEDDGPARVFDGNFAVMDVRTAQRLFARQGRVDRIEVAHASRAAIAAACPKFRVEPVRRVSSFIQDAIARLDSLVAVSVVALLVGVFIVYNTVAVSVVERVKTIGTLRALGATKRQIRQVFLIEWLLLGGSGATAGVLLGWGLARILVKFAAGTINTLILAVDVREVPLPLRTALLAIGLGIVVSLLAVWWPARDAMNVSPIAILRPYTYRLSRSGRAPFWIGIAIIVLGAVLFLSLDSYTVTGLATTGLFFIGVALALPAATRWVSEWLRPFLRRHLRIEGFIGADNVAKFPQRTALTATALAGTLAMLIATATLVQGFSVATRRWMDEAFPFDLSISATDLKTTVYSHDAFESAVRNDIAAVPGVDLAYGVKSAFTGYRDKDIMLIAVEFGPFWQAQQQRPGGLWQQTLAEPAALAAFQSGQGVCVSENFAYRFGVSPGEIITLDTPSGARTFRVLKTIEDYSWPQGVVCLDLGAYRAAFGDDTLTYVDVRLQAGALRDDVRAAIAERLDGRQLFVFSIDMLKKGADDAVQQVMVFANVQVLIAITIGFLGIVNTLMISVLQRTREIGLLRAVGMSRRQIGRAVLVEALIIGAVGGIIGIVTGLAGGLGPLRMFTLGMTGYLTPVVIPWIEVLGAFVAALLIAAVAAVVPARRAAAVNVIEAIGYE